MVGVGVGVCVGGIANIVTEILMKSSSHWYNEFTLASDFKDELTNLLTTLNMIMVVVEEAEKKQVSNEVVRLWMEELKSLAYDAQDILDDFSYEIICKRTQMGEVRKPSLDFCSTMVHEIKQINEKFNIIAKRKNDLGLQSIDMGSSSSHELMMKNKETNSFVPKDWKIVGRENDKSTIIKMLLEKEEEEEEEEENISNNQGGGGSKHVSVIPIVGMGGLGKTTLAKQVYNDEAIEKHFELKIWICVSDPFDIKKLYINIANSIGKGKKYDATTMDAISHLLQDVFSRKKFIIVLDDVWNENLEYWNNFKKPFMVSRAGSKILVTTRSEKSALIMVNKFQPYRLGILNENDCWSLFKEKAFGFGVEETPKLVEIGKEMVNRCKGLPLAIIFLGSLMQSKKKEMEWKVIRDSKLWHQSEILPSLRLSYDYLPSNLKLCFSYCCLFPKDLRIYKRTLIGLWMAEGFLIETPGENSMSMDEIGNEYFHSLSSSFFFQDVYMDEDGDFGLCKMHDLVHDLARSVIGNHECLIVENAADIDYISEETRRLNLLIDLNDKEVLTKVLKTVKKAKKLRTIFINTQEICFDIGKALEENKRLRVLDLSGWTSFSIGGLKHLRYLDVNRAKGIGGLSFLQTLDAFSVGDENLENGGGIQELECLNNLRGNLTIYRLQNVKNGTTACRANLKNKKNLRSLKLHWGDLFSDSDHEINNVEAVMEGLRPHSNLIALEIHDFQGSKLPMWMGDSSCLPNLENLKLYFCSYEQLAGFGALPSLRSLTLQTLLSLKEWVVPPPPPSTTTPICFPLLEKIDIFNCPLLTTITPTTTFPSLKVLSLTLTDRRAANTLISNNLKSLTSLKLWTIPNLITLPRQGLIENNDTLLSLIIMDCPQFKGFLLPNMDDDEDDKDGGGQPLIQRLSKKKKKLLQQLSLAFSSSSSAAASSSSLQSAASSSSSSLQSLKLYDCPALRFYPNILGLTSLRELEIKDCKESKSLRSCLSSSSSSSLKHLKYVKIWKN